MEQQTQTAWPPNRIFALIVGIVFLILGILGLIVAPTHGNILGFDVDLVHNLVHLITGLVALAAVYTGYSRRFNQVFGAIYLALGILGLFPFLYFNQRLLGIIHSNAADQVLHLVVGAVGVYLGYFLSEYEASRRTAARY